jgi:hypothetical protein
MRRSSLLFVAAVLMSLTAAHLARADEFKLKDGSTIVGAVVGYEGNSFRVKTSYGYALVEKDKIVSIKIGGAPETAPEQKAGESAAKRTARAAKGVEEHASAAKQGKPKSTAGAGKPKPEIASRAPAPAPVGSSASAARSSAAQSTNALVVSAAPANAAAAPDAQPATAPNNPPGPQPIREKISGNTYINDTYDFEMYKPPDWEVMDGARSVLPGAVAAMGTDDQSTYLVVGQEAAGKSAAADISATEKRLNDILVNYRPTGDEHLTVSGEQVVAHRFRGNVDQQDWSGFMVFMPRGAKLYTIFGMTRADNDLVQIQENVIRRTIASFQFLPQQGAPAD